MEKFNKTIRLLLEMCGLPVFLIIDKAPRVSTQRDKTNLMCGSPLFPSFLVFFDRVFFLFMSKRDFLSSTGMCFGSLAVAIVNSNSFSKSKMKKILSKIAKSWVQNFRWCESRSSDQNTAVIQFFLWKVAIPYFWEPNDLN